MSRPTATTGIDAETQRRIDEHVAELIADWPAPTDRQREVIRNAFRAHPVADPSPADDLQAVS